MPKRNILTEGQKAEIETTRKAYKKKEFEKRLLALFLFACKSKTKEIAQRTGFHPVYITRFVSKYIKGDIEAITRNYHSRNLQKNRRRRKIPLLRRSLCNLKTGALAGIRTPDLRLRRATLYPVELQAHNRWNTANHIPRRGFSQGCGDKISETGRW